MKYLLYNLITYKCYRKGSQIMFSILPSRYLILDLSSSKTTEIPLYSIRFVVLPVLD